MMMPARCTQSWVLVLALLLGLLAAAAVNGGGDGGSDCAASDAKLRKWREMLCSSLTQANTPWCGEFHRNGAATDWPSQAVYMVQILATLKSPDTCLNTTFARDTVGWLNAMQTTAVSTTGNFFWTWLVFQVQYYDMPRHPGVRIEAPDTLGRKCWAFAFLKEQFGEQALVDALRQHALQMPSFISNYTAAIPLTMDLCDKVRANCFLNSSYDPRHSGTCPAKLAEFVLGFERENFKPQQGRSRIADPWKGTGDTSVSEDASLPTSSCTVVRTSPRGATAAVGVNATCEVLLAGASARLELDRLPPSQAASNSLPSDAPNYLDAQVFAHTTPPSGVAPPRKAIVANIVSGAANRYYMTDETAVLLALAARQASSAPLDVILFPECFLYNGSNAEVCDGTDGDDGNSCRGPHATTCAHAARMTNAYVVCPFYELASAASSQDAGPMYNTAILLDRAGRQVGKYRKTFPTAEIFPPSTGEVNEGVLPGNLGVPVFDTDFGRVAILICWDFDFPEVWHAAASQGAELILWPSAGKGGLPIEGYALTHNVFVASNGAGQFVDRLGRNQPPDRAFNYTCPSSACADKHGYPHAESIPIAIKTLDLDSTIVFTGGPGAKKQAWDNFLADAETKYGVKEIWSDDIANWSLLEASASGNWTVRAALRANGIETRREESMRNRWTINNKRKAMVFPT